MIVFVFAVLGFMFGAVVAIAGFFPPYLSPWDNHIQIVIESATAVVVMGAVSAAIWGGIAFAVYGRAGR